MTESEFRRLSLLAAFEREPCSPWTATDGIWASDEARRRVGEGADLDRWAVCRAELGLTRLGERSLSLRPLIGVVTAPSIRPGPALGVALVVGFLCGVLLSAVGDLDHIDLLSPPLLGLLGWNALGYAFLLFAALHRGTERGPGGGALAPPVRGLAATLRPLRDGLLRRLGRSALRAARLPDGPVTGDPGPDPPRGGRAEGALARFQAQWIERTAPLWALRLRTGLHGMAAAVALGALAALYARGLAFELRATWDSTFLGPHQALTLVRTVLGPASAVSGLPLPAAADLASFEALRGARGGGQNAAPWIHLWALTLGGFVVLPRALLAAASAWQARRMATRMPVDWHADPVLAGLANQHRRGRVQLQLLPYRLQVGDAARERWRAQLGSALGGAPVLQWADAALEGDEDAAADRAASTADPEAWPVVLVSAAHTPERETHGRLLQAVARRRPAAAPALVLVDEAGFGARWSVADAAQRRRERRAAWQALAQELGHDAVFISLGEAPAGDGGGLHDLARRLSSSTTPA